MALFANQRRRPQQGIYPGSGVAQGGQQGRKTTIHNGFPSARKGGKTPMASLPKPKPKPPMGPRPKPRPEQRPPRGPVPYPTGRPGNLFGLTGPTAATPSPATGGRPGFKPSPAFTTHDSVWAQAMADINYDYDTAGLDIPALRAQIEANKVFYDKQRTDLQRADMRERDNTYANLANRGVFQSGGRTVFDVDQSNKYLDAMQGIEANVGGIAANRIMGQIDSIEAQRLRERNYAQTVAERDAAVRALENFNATSPLSAGGTNPVTSMSAIAGDPNGAQTAIRADGSFGLAGASAGYTYKWNPQTQQYTAAPTATAAPAARPAKSQSGKVYQQGFIMKNGKLYYQDTAGGLKLADQSKKGKVNLLS